MRWVRTIAVAGAASALLAGCPFPIPSGYEFISRENVGDGVPVFIKTGITTREEVMMRLGEPDAVAVDDSWLAYASAYGLGGMGLVVFAGGGAGGVAGWQTRYRRLILRFDELRVVSHPNFESKTCTEYGGGMGAKGDYTKPCLDIWGEDTPATHGLSAKRRW
ncbi:MAG: hypothetical protein OEZ08_10785 [Betaproteobacteria bacterium]|nr:hypothetical protein [Betaproteobacteria bacterium]